MNIEVKEKRGIKRWYYDFTLERKRHRDFLDPVESMLRRQAVAAVERIRAAIISKGSEYKREKRIDIKEIFDSYKTYLEEHRKSTFKNFRYVFHSFRVFHDGDITMDDIVEYQKKRSSEEASGATINREIGIAKAAFNRAIKNGIWKRQNPFQLADKYEAIGRGR